MLSIFKLLVPLEFYEEDAAVKVFDVSNVLSSISLSGPPVISDVSHVRPVISPSGPPVISDHFPEIKDNSEDEEAAVEILWTKWRDMQRLAESVFDGPRNLFCQVIEDAVKEFHLNKVQSSQLPRIHVTAELSCLELYMMSGFGTGNYIQLILMMRMAVKHLSIAHVKLNITCTDTEEVQRDLILPWLTGVWYSPNYFDSNTSSALQMPNFLEMQGSLLYKQQQIEDSRYCGPVGSHYTYLMYRELHYDLRRMAIALLGVSLVGTDHIHASKIQRFIERYIIRDDIMEKEHLQQSVHLSPGNQQKRISKRVELVPSFSPEDLFDSEVDDAVIHFRCGDVLSGNYKGYGFMSFPDYSQHISSNVRSIGILAQPFCQETNIDDSSVIWFRKADMAYCERCEILSLGFKQFLSEEFPYATVNIRNTPSEPLSVVYARMVLANQTVGALSSFSLYPLLATFGHGYYLQRGGVKMWLTASPDNFEVFDASKLRLGSELKDLWDTEGEDAVLHWFRTAG